MNNMNIQIDQREMKARQATICEGCDKPKDKGLVVCWGCFKYRDNAFKYFDGSLDEWLEDIK